MCSIKAFALAATLSLLCLPATARPPIPCDDSEPFTNPSTDQRVRVETAPAPSWAVDPWPDASPNPPPVPGAGGVEFLLASEQHNPASMERHYHYLLRCKNIHGVRDASRIEIEFDPEYHSLTINRLEIIRDGRTIPARPASGWRVIQREDSLSENIFDGARTAICFIEDVRPGDLIDYAYTLKGDNPAYKGLWFDTLALGWDVPVGRVFYRLLIPPGRNIAWKQLGPPLPGLTVEERGGKGADGEIRWQIVNLPAFHPETDAPEWVIQTPLLQITEMKSWDEVADWGCAIYQTGGPEPALDALVNDLASRAGAKPDVLAGRGTLAQEIVCFVQDEVRYQAFHNGAFAFLPSSPAGVATRRFGDCKDKTRLLVDLLGRAGIRAHPALVSSSIRGGIKDFLPSPFVFDHVIVRVDDPQLGGAWIDATTADQGGTWNARAIVPFGLALEMREGISHLTEVSPPPAARSKSLFEYKFKSRRIGDPVELEVVTDVFGEEADNLRSFVNDAGESSAARSFLRNLLENFPEATQKRPPEFTDDRAANHFTIREHYVLPDFWAESDDAKTWIANLYANEIAATLPSINSLKRDVPLALGSPRNVTQKILVELPEQWSFDDVEVEVALPEFVYRSKAICRGRLVTLEHEFESLASHAPAERVREINRGLEKIRGHLGFQITKESPPAAAAFRKFLRAVKNLPARQEGETAPSK